MSDKRRTRTTPSEQRGDLAIRIAHAELALEDGDDAKAEREVGAALGTDPDLPEAHFLLGEIARRRTQRESAMRHYRKAIQLDARVAAFHHALGGVLQDAGTLDEAIDCYRRALRLVPGVPGVWNDLGTAYFAAGEPARAVDCYRRALTHDPRNTIALTNLGAALRATGDVRGASAAYARELWQRLRGLPGKLSPSREAGSLAARWWRRGSVRLASALVDQALALNAADVVALTLKAELAKRQGDQRLAIELLERALTVKPREAQLWLRLAESQASSVSPEAAIEAYRTALRVGGGEKAQRGLALTLAGQKQFDEALALLEKLAKTDPTIENHLAIARVSLDRGDEARADGALGQALSLDPNDPVALALLGRLNVAQRKAVKAVQLCDLALENDPASAEAHYWRGRALGLLDAWSDAVDAFRQAVEIDPASSGRVRWLAVALRAAGRLDESEAVLQTALRQKPGDVELRAELAQTTFERGDIGRARELLQEILRDRPDHVPAIAAMAFVLDVEGRLDEAESYARDAIRREPGNPVAHHNLGLRLLKLGEYQEGWEQYEWRKKLEHVVAGYLRFPFPEWNGEQPAGRALLVYAEQGLGDEIMFSSCIPDLARQASRVFIECEPRLGALFRRSFPQCAVFARTRTTSNAWVQSLEPQPDWQIPIASLGRFFRQHPSNFPHHQGYLTPDPAKVERWRTWLKALGPGLKIGISWRGGLIKTGRARRSLDLNELETILKIEGVRFVSLQYGAVNEELARLERLRGIRIPHIQEAIDDYDESAALICALDLVVSVCTSVVHLAGALGRPTLVMAPYSPEWRYGFSGDSIPWYPSVKVLRQQQAGEWGLVLNDVREALRERLNTA